MPTDRTWTRSWTGGAAVLVAVAVAVPVLASGLSYESGAGFHAGIEIVGALIGGATAFALVVRYLAVGDRFELVTGLAFAVNAAADLVHGAIPLATLNLGLGASPELSRFIPATYVAGRLAMSTLLVLAVVSTPRTMAARVERRREAVVAGVGSTVATILLAGLMAALDLPDALHPNWIVPRPFDALSALIFATAFVVLAREHVRHRRGDGMARWVAVTAGVALVGQTTMAFSETLYGPRFDVAHGLKILSYLVPLAAFIAAQVRALNTERAVTERLREADRMRARLVRTVTHELRTPLVVITGFADALADESLTPQQRADYVARLRRNAGTLHRLIEEVLLFGEGTDGGASTERIDVAAHLRQLIDQLEPILGSHEVVAVGDGPAPVSIDGHALDRIATNLLTNAVRYAPAGTAITVTVEHEREHVRLSVADQGAGVPEDERELVFQPFYRGSAPATLRHRGSGIGLAVVRQLAEQAGGSVDVHDTDEGGACFVVTLPAA